MIYVFVYVGLLLFFKQMERIHCIKENKNIKSQGATPHTRQWPTIQ